MVFNSAQLIDDLQSRLERTTVIVKKLQQLSEAQLNFKKSAESWSVLECLEHLNLYGDFYLPELESQMLKNSHKLAQPTFKSGVIGNYFAKMMLVKEGKMTKMKTFKDKDPANSDLKTTTIDRFLKQQEKMIWLLEQARKVDLTSVTIGITLTRFLRIRLGDGFRFNVYHIERHVLQAEKAHAPLS